VSPTLALLSAPCHSGMGLPSLAAVERIEAHGAEVWWTGSVGAVLVGAGRRQTDARIEVRGWGDDRGCSLH